MKLTRKKGSVAVEFVLSFLMLVIVLGAVIRFGILAISSEMTQYATYLGARSLKVNPNADVKRVINKVSYWIDKNRISYGVSENHVFVGVDKGEKRIQTILRKQNLDTDQYEDNPVQGDYWGNYVVE